MREVFALCTGDVGKTFVGFEAVALHGGAVGDGLADPVFFSAAGEEVGKGVNGKRFRVVGVETGVVGEGVLCDEEFGTQAGSFDIGAVKAGLRFVGVNDGGLSGLKEALCLFYLRFVGDFLGSDGVKFFADGEDVEIGFADFEEKGAVGVVQLAIAKLCGDFFRLVLIPAYFVEEGLADLHVPAMGLVFVVGVLGAVAVVDVCGELRQESRFGLLLWLLCGIAGMTRGIVIRRMHPRCLPGFIQIEGVACAGETEGQDRKGECGEFHGGLQRECLYFGHHDGPDMSLSMHKKNPRLRRARRGFWRLRVYG